MSKLKMLKFEAAALQSNGKSLIERLQKMGVTQFDKVDDARLFEASASESASTFEKSIDVINEAMSVLTESGISFGTGMFSGRKELSETDYGKRCENAKDVLDSCYEVIRLNKYISECQGEIVRNTTLIDSLSSWEKLDIPMVGVSTKYASAFVGSLPKEYTLSELNTLIGEALPHINEYCIDIVHSSKMITCISVVCHRDVEKDILSFLRSVSFTAPPELSDVSVADKLCELNDALEKCKSGIEVAKQKLKSYKDKIDDIKFAYDYFTVKRDEYKALENVRFSESSVYLRGYVPERCAGRLSKLITESGGAVVYSEPSEDDDVPVALSNGKFSEPVESIVEMYAMPGKGDIDPSAAMAFLYYLLFGMMLSDAGYGLIMTIGTAIILKKTNVEGGMRKMLKMFFYSGISTVVWGALFGSWFGDIVPVVCTNFLGIQNPPDMALWFEPIKDPIKLLLFSFVVGIAHLFLGLVLLGYTKWKDGDKLGAILDTIPIMMTVLGAAPLAGSILVSVPAFLTAPAKWLLIAGVVLIVLTSSRSSKNIFARLGGGLYALYNTASGYLSDILSYSRLLALGLATGSIASVVNMLAVMIDVPVLKYVVFILIFIVGHTLNMAINVLGAYVHTNRLQFVELFSKFYEGGGRVYEPFKFNTKYFKLKEENKNE